MSSFEFQDSMGKLLLEDHDGKLWFLAQDVYETIGYKNGSRDVSRNVSKKNRISLNLPDNMRTGRGNPKRIFLNEDGVAELLSRAVRMPNAKPFQKWLANTVVPAGMKKLNLLPSRQIVEIDSRYSEALKQIFQAEEYLSKQNESILAEIKSLRSAMRIDGMNWRDAAKFIVNSASRGNRTQYRAVYHELYAAMDKTLGIKLSVRKKNLQKKTGKKDISTLDVIAADKKLIPTFVSLLRTYALSHSIYVEIQDVETSIRKGVA